MNTGGPAPEKTLLDEFAGRVLESIYVHVMESNVDRKESGLEQITRSGVARECYSQASAMLAEKARREANHSEDKLGKVDHSLDAAKMVPPREVDNDYWLKFQDGARVVFQPGNGWCAEIREGSMGYGNTIAEAIQNLRARWEERNVAPEQSANSKKIAALEAANRELAEALEALLDCISETRGKNASDAVANARAILAKHKATK